VDSSGHAVVVFDGECAFCNRWVDFLLRVDRKDTFRFSARQSQSGAAFSREAAGRSRLHHSGGREDDPTPLQCRDPNAGAAGPPFFARRDFPFDPSFPSRRGLRHDRTEPHAVVRENVNPVRGCRCRPNGTDSFEESPRRANTFYAAASGRVISTSLVLLRLLAFIRLP
jgi:hypothetical protein